MDFDTWLEKRGGEVLPVEASLAREAWDAALAEVRVQFYKRANWVSLNGLFGPERLRELADQVEEAYGGPELH